MTADLMPAQDARLITDRIKTAVEATWELIKEAYTRRAWSALGYDSWDDYCTREFGTSRLRLPREERQEVVASLRESGMSVRAIAAATGISKNTVTSDVSQIGTPDSDPIPVTGTDGKTYTPPAPKPPATDLITADDLAALNAPTAPVVDRQPRQPSRQPLPDAFWRAAVEARKSIERVERLTDDDRFGRNLDEITRLALGDLVRARDAIERVINQITPGV
jgi:hypothetical protein